MFYLSLKKDYFKTHFSIRPPKMKASLMILFLDLFYRENDLILAQATLTHISELIEDIFSILSIRFA